MEGKTESAAHGDRYLAHLAHELRTPLTAIIGYADAMRARMFGPLDDRYADYAEIIVDAGRHMLELAEDLLARARIGAVTETPTVERFDAAEPIARALRLMAIEAEAAGVTVRFAPPAAALEMISDRRALMQVVVNLVANAIRHTPAGGTATLALQAWGEGLVQLTVSDTGSGLAPGWEAAGMGLRLVRGLVETRGGTMELGDAPGGGTMVTIHLPAQESTP